MRILVVGNGGREHALLWALHRDSPTAELFATKPNPGMARIARSVPIGPMEIEALSGWAASQRIDLAVDDHGRAADEAQRRGPVAGGEHRAQLAGEAARVDAGAVPGPAGDVAGQCVAEPGNLRGKADQHPFPGEDSLLLEAVYLGIGIPPRRKAPAQAICRQWGRSAHATHSETGAAASCSGCVATSTRVGPPLARARFKVGPRSSGASTRQLSMP